MRKAKPSPHPKPTNPAEWWRDEIRKRTDEWAPRRLKIVVWLLIVNLPWTAWRTYDAHTRAGLYFQIFCLVCAVIGLYAHAQAWAIVARREHLARVAASRPVVVVPRGIQPRTRVAEPPAPPPANGPA